MVTTSMMVRTLWWDSDVTYSYIPVSNMCYVIENRNLSTDTRHLFYSPRHMTPATDISTLLGVVHGMRPCCNEEY